MTTPPRKKEAAPAKEAASSGERKDIATLDATPQGSALAALCKNWLRCDVEARWQFLLDVKRAHPALFHGAMKSEASE